MTDRIESKDSERYEGPKELVAIDSTSDVACCDDSDEKMNDLEGWYKGYTDQWGGRVALESVRQDDIDLSIIKQRIYQTVQTLEPVSAGGFCKQCLAYLGRWPENMKMSKAAPDVEIYMDSALQFQASARNGCRLCAFWTNSIHPEDWKALYQVENRLSKLKKNTAITIKMSSHRALQRGLLCSLSRYGSTDSMLQWSLDVIPISRIGSAALSDDAMSVNPKVRALSTAETWISECWKSHDNCRPSEHYPYPSRLVLVKEDSLKVVSTRGWTEKIRYATLSHCWGTLEFLKLMRENLPSFLISIPLEKLTRTFKDAIEIARYLRIDYLWIDSLCIIQNDPEDWNLEAGKMSAVYSGSHVNIAATTAADGDGGCFVDEGLCRSIRSTRLEVEGDTGSDFYALVDRSQVYAAYRHMNIDSPLAGRAWVLQERLLAPRTLHCTQWGAFWECKTKDAYESFPELLPEIFYPARTHEEYKPPLEARWHDIVHQYSKCDLTYSSDKLVAISGIARAINKKTGSQYLAGMWRENLEAQLCWQAEYSDRPRPSYRAPSWSWAALDSPCLPPSEPSAWLEAHILDAYITPLGPDPFGQVCGGTISLSVQGMLSYPCPSDPQLLVRILDPVSKRVYELKLYTFRDCQEDEVDTIYAVPIFSYPNRTPRTISESGNAYRGLQTTPDLAKRVEGLMLRPTQRIQGEFQRIGRFFCANRGPHWVEAWEALGAETARANCAEILDSPEHLGEKYVITIV